MLILHILIFILSCSPSRHFQDRLFKADTILTS